MSQDFLIRVGPLFRTVGIEGDEIVNTRVDGHDATAGVRKLVEWLCTGQWYLAALKGHAQVLQHCH